MGDSAVVHQKFAPNKSMQLLVHRETFLAHPTAKHQSKTWLVQ
jgi:hypothetical protein